MFVFLLLITTDAFLIRSASRLPRIVSSTEDDFGVTYHDTTRTTTLSNFLSTVDGKRVALLSNCFFVDDTSREAWVSELVSRCAALPVVFQRRTTRGRGARMQPREGTSDECKDDRVSVPMISVSSVSFEATLGEFVEECFSSCHDDSIFLLDEDLLVDDPASGVSELARQVAILPAGFFPDGDMFDLFPEAIRPKKPCLLIGGAGARSTLHADPYSWTGWNYLAEGSKIWTFFPPDQNTAAEREAGGGLLSVEEAFKARRLESSAWDEGRFNVSAGWQSPVDLYHERVAASEWPTAMDLGVMNSEDHHAALDGIQEACEGSHFPFIPSEPACLLERLQGPMSQAVPQSRRRVSVVQRAGELLLIPPRWWHQTYYLEPCVAVAGQYLNENNFGSVSKHILDWCNYKGAGYDFFQYRKDGVGAHTAISKLIQIALVSKHGEAKGMVLFSQLYNGSKL